MILDLNYLINKYNLDIKGVVQIGAHFGQELEAYLNYGIRNFVFFEPHPETFKVLEKTVGNCGTCIPLALANYIGEADMFCETANQGMSNSLLEPDTHLSQYPHIQFNNKIKVNVSKLDEFLIFAPNHNFLNIDTQGTELEILKGGPQFLNYVDYIMVEVNRDEVYKGCAKVEEIDSFLSNFGFKRVETNWLGVSWGDAFYVKG